MRQMHIVFAFYHLFGENHGYWILVDSLLCDSIKFGFIRFWLILFYVRLNQVWLNIYINLEIMVLSLLYLQNKRHSKKPECLMELQVQLLNQIPKLTKYSLVMLKL